MRDTWFGLWISTKLVLLMEYLNNYVLDAIPGKTVNVVSNFMAFLGTRVKRVKQKAGKIGESIE